jgi:hypothetical protein
METPIKKRGRGQPRSETKFPDNWKELILESGRQGKHITDFLIKLDISWENHDNLLERNKEYSETVLQYQKLCENWWFENAHSHMVENGGARYNQRLWSLIMRNKFGKRWSDKQEVDVTSQGDKIQQNKLEIEIIKKSDIL